MNTVFWLFQNNYVKHLTENLARAVRESGRMLWDFSYLSEKGLPDFEIPPGAKPFFYGSTAMVSKAKSDPVYASSIWFDADSFDQRAWQLHCGTDMLNHDGQILAMGAIADVYDGRELFMRPLQDMKAFVGTTVKEEAFPGWLATQYERNYQLNDEALVWVAPVKAIEAEYRFVVVDHEIKVGSSYRKNNTLFKSTEIPADVAKAAADFAKGWQPSRVAVMDVCKLVDGSFRIVEFNCVHCSGLYAISLLDFAHTIEEAFSGKGV